MGRSENGFPCQKEAALNSVNRKLSFDGLLSAAERGASDFSTLAQFHLSRMHKTI